MLFEFVRALRRQRSFVLHGAIAVMIAVLSAGWYEFNLGDGEILTVFLAVMACGYVAIDPRGTDDRLLSPVNLSGVSTAQNPPP